MQPRKRFGQHFLCDPTIIDRIVTLLAPKATDELVEIGPGQGALTVPVLAAAKKLTAIEFDRDLIATLKARCLGVGELTIFNTDVLQFDFLQLNPKPHGLRVFGNLPYNISTPLIFHLLTYSDYIADMVFMFQREVAERLAASVNSKHYGRLSIMVQYHCEVDLAFNIPATAFFPQPQVQSSMVKLTPYRNPPYHAHHYDLFATLVREAFSHRRKTLRNSLKTYVPDDVWASLAIRSDRRAENLTIKDFVDISNAITLPNQTLKKE